jgi:glycosyltransferase involved in cell wall biosynthesis
MIFIVSMGLGIFKRGLESHARDLFDNLKENPSLEIKLLKGGGKSKNNEIRIWSLPWGSNSNTIISFLTQRTPYQIQNLSFFIGMIWTLWREKPEVLYLGEHLIYERLVALRKRCKLHYKIIFYTGGQIVPSNFDARDSVQYITPFLRGVEAIPVLGSYSSYSTPLFLNLNSEYSFADVEEKQNLKEQHGIPSSSTLVLSVGSIDRSVKRMDYIIQEMCQLDLSFFLVMIGEKHEETEMIRRMAKEKLPNRHLILTVSRSELINWYRIADLFVLASLKEGFGLVYIEALSHGLPVLAHDFPVAKYVLGDYGHFADFTQQNNLEKLIIESSKTPSSMELKWERRRQVETRFSWTNLKSRYIAMLNDKQLN